MSSKTPAKFLKTILVGTDFSVCAARAFSFAVSLAHSQGAKVHLLHVLMEPVQAFIFWTLAAATLTTCVRARWPGEAGARRAA